MRQPVPFLSRDLVLSSRVRIDDSRTLVRRVFERRVRDSRLRAERSEERISRTLTLLLEAAHRLQSWPEGARPVS